MGKLAMKRLIKEVEHESQEDLEDTIVLKPEVIIRDST
jgi:DNA-binding LacI/PurR family transcriptional regulator